LRRIPETSIPYIGYILTVTSTSLIISGFYGVYLYYLRGHKAELEPASIMLFYGILYLSLGLLISRLPRQRLRAPTAISITVLAWVLIPVLGAFPFAEALKIPYIDALFESVSGWTTTGLTILSGQPSSWHHVYVPKVEQIPICLQVWRTVMQWEGGLGIVVFTLGIMAQPGISAAALYLAEGRQEKIEASVRATAVKALIIYSTYTVIGAALFYLAGMNLYDAISHSMTGIATAGFSTHTQSIGYYINKPVILVVAMTIMYLGAMNFKDHYALFTGRFRYLKESIETKAQILIIGLSIIVAIILWLRNPIMHKEFTLLQIIFHVVSSSATAGFQAGDLSKADDAYKILLASLALLGGSAFSTAGGIKILRLVIAVKTIGIESGILLHPSGYRPRTRLGRYYLDAELLRRALAVIAAMTLTHLVLSTALSGLYPQYSIADSMFEVASAMGNVGLSVGISSAAAPVGAKIILILAMLLGRLEVVTYIVALRFTFSKLAHPR
jgi:trk system potassium uptake protein TrkH